MSEALRDAAKVALAALELHARTYPHMVKGYTHDAANMLHAALAQPQAPSVPAGIEAMREVIQRMASGIDHLDKLAREWEPDHSSGADRRGWLLAKDARDDAARMLAAAPPVAQEAAPLVQIAPDARKGKPPCGECHLQPGEKCDICGAQEAAEAVAPADDIAALVDAYGMATADEAGSGHKSAQAYAALAKSNLMDAIKALAAAPAGPIPTRATLIAALQWYADGLHFDKASPDAWDTVSGEPQNWWCDEAGTATIEDGSIAAMTLRGELTAEQLQEFEAGEAAAPVGLDANAATWQPISTAPKSGRDLILLLTPSGFPQVAYSNTWWTAGFSVEVTPTHWMKLPEPPNA